MQDLSRRAIHIGVAPVAIKGDKRICNAFKNCCHLAIGFLGSEQLFAFKSAGKAFNDFRARNSSLVSLLIERSPCCIGERYANSLFRLTVPIANKLTCGVALHQEPAVY